MKRPEQVLKLQWLWLIGLFTILSSGCANTTIRQHPDFFGAKRTIRSIAVLPPQVSQVHITFTGDNEHDFNVERQIAADIANSARTNLELKGYAVNSDLQARLEGSDQQFNFQYEQFKSAYAQASKELYFRRMVPVAESSKFKVGLGPIAGQLSQATNSDALLFVGYNGFTKSGGQQTKDMVASVLLGVLTGVVIIQAARGGGMEVALVDGESGDVLWTNVSGAPNADSAMLLGIALKPFPDIPIAPAATIAGSDNTTANAAAKPGAVSIQDSAAQSKPAE